MPSKQKKDVSSQSVASVSPEIKSAKTPTKIEPLRGHLERRFVRCGKANCKCAKGELHGPYFLRRWRNGGKKRSNYVKKRDVFVTFKAVSEYKRNKQETRELIRDINRTGNGMLKALGAVLRSWNK
jgi:Family of unknown function (DUF6788)